MFLKISRQTNIQTSVFLLNWIEQIVNLPARSARFGLGVVLEKSKLIKTPF